MAITATVTNLSKRINPQGVDLTTGLKIALFLSTATITAASTLYSGLTNEVANGSGYTTGGKSITGGAWSGTSSPKFTGSIADYTSSTFTFRYAVIYDVATSKIIGYYDFGTDQSVIDGTLSMTFDTNGMILVTSS
jgi:hypothetical protein